MRKAGGVRCPPEEPPWDGPCVLLALGRQGTAALLVPFFLAHPAGTETSWFLINGC